MIVCICLKKKGQLTSSSGSFIDRTSYRRWAFKELDIDVRTNLLLVTFCTWFLFSCQNVWGENCGSHGA